MDINKSTSKFELSCGVVLAIFAAVLAITNIWSNKFADDAIIAYNEKSNAYDWYNTKGVKQNLAEGQRDILKSLLSTGVVKEEQEGGVANAIKDLDVKVEKYKKEKQEILLGSKAVGKENWVQDVDGKMGVVIGTKEWEEKANKLYNLGDTFNLSILFLQLCLVFGAISLVLHILKIKWIILWCSIISGSLGFLVSIFAFLKAFNI